MPVVESLLAETATDLSDAAETLGYPVALKTAAEGVHHKSDVDGVVLGLKDAAELNAAYESLSTRLGPKALVSEMAEPGLEMALGMFTDPTAGPVVVVGPGGTLVEFFDERVFAIPPFDADTARRLLSRLKFSRVLKGARGKPGVDIDALASALSCFSVLCAALSDHIAENRYQSVNCRAQRGGGGGRSGGWSGGRAVRFYRKPPLRRGASKMLKQVSDAVRERGYRTAPQ